MTTLQKAVLHVHGKVQGVYYRASAQQKARQLGVNGYVKNLENGIVYIEVEGTDDAINQFIEWCQLGPSSARVEDVDVSFDTSTTGYSTFQIHY